MDPMIDIDQELSTAMRVEPGPDFAARVRTRIAAEPAPTGFQIPVLALGAMGCVALIAVIATVMTTRSDRTVQPVLAARHDMPTTTLRSAVQSIPAATRMPAPMARIVGRPFRGAGARSSDVIVSRSEMLALQRLLSGAIAMPPASEPPSDAQELSIPAISLDPIPVLPGSSGERQ